MKMSLENVPMVDKDIVMERLDGDGELYDELVEIYFSDVPMQYKIMQDSFYSDDRKTLERQAHSMKSASANIGAERLRAVVFKLEKTALDGEKTEIAALIEQFNEEYLLLEKHLGRA
ncbi:MAG: Hpt domain-containing protein [Deltaproteobacteria bacterium]|nr:Hpt domain-containing protein [Deltaproteobacteria bacterium]